MRPPLRLVLANLALAAAVLGGCGVAPTARPTSTVLPAPSNDVGLALSAGELRLLLIERLGPLWWCDSDSFPLDRDEFQSMRERWPQVLADADLLNAILAELELPSIVAANLTDEQRLAVYRRWKVASAVNLEVIGDGRYRFDYLAEPAPGAAQGTRSTGTVDATGRITIEQSLAADAPICPICLAVGQSIDTPDGAIAVQRLRLGDTVWTLDGEGRRVPATIIALGSAVAPAGHRVVALRLLDGRTVLASPGHPLADGRRLGGIRVGDVVDGSVVTEVRRLDYASARTFDIVVSGETGIYLAGGIPLRSTVEVGRS